MLNLSLRAANFNDHSATRAIVVAAFANAGEETAVFLDQLRADGCILGEWLAEDEDTPIAHIVFSRVWIDGIDGVRHNAVMLMPLAVRPDRQRTGVGTMLMAYALEALE